MSNTAEIIDLTRQLPTQSEIDNASDAAQALAAAQTKEGGLKFANEYREEVSLSPSICNILIDLLGHVARGNMVTIVPTGSMLTTQQAADMLNVSRPYLSGLLKDGTIDYVPVGSHRRVPLSALLNYKEKRDNERYEAIKELSALGQEFDAS